jgi:uncharacterized caspase-like protein
MRILAFFLLFFVPTSILAQDRLALVIGNDAYTEVPKLTKAVADARAIGAKLRDLGFETIQATDLDRRGMNGAISKFTARLDPGDIAFVFFAGHGVEIDSENYLLPTEIVAPNSGEDDFVKSESIALSSLLDRVRKTGARLSIAIIDACRNNPFETVAGRSIGRTRGLGRINAPQGMFVIFSAGAGQLALDELHENDTAQNSVFTRALLPRMSRPGLELRTLVSDLRLEVRDLARTVQHSQVPAYYDELLGEFYFTPVAASAARPTGQAPQLPEAQMRADLDLARSIGTAMAYDSFLEKYAGNSESYSYEVALQLRQGLETPEKTAQSRHAESNPPTPPDATPVSAPSDNNREVIRATQRALNNIGCSAGGADGVVGPRTRRAFRSYRAASGSVLNQEDLGSQNALKELKAVKGNVCKPANSQTATTQTAVTTTPTARPAPKTFSLSGSWSFKATCALLVKVTGTVRYASAGGNKYNGRLSDSLGQQANTEVYLNERQISGTDFFPGITVTWRGRLASDGKSFTANGSTGCAVYAWRTG